ncbi:MAG: DUF2232 domain-containing protein [Clostridia bacterium]|nr:DUF2232 domain-containing protein [Clostridia bacterium]
MKDYVFRILLAALLCVPLIFGFPFLSVLALCSLFTYNLVKNSFKVFAVIAAVVLLIMFAAFRGNIPAILSFFGLLVIVSYVLGMGISKKKTFSSTMISTVTAAIAAITLILLYYTHTTGKTAFTLLFGDYIEVLKQTFAQLDISSDFADLFAQQLELMMPSFIIISTAITVYIVFCISRGFLERNGYMIDNMPHFEELSLNRTFSTVFLFILLFSMFDGVSAVAMNIIMVVVTLFAMCGLSVGVYYIKTFGLPKAIRVIIYILLVVIMMFVNALGGIPTIVLLIVGVIDSYRPLRFRKGE